MMTSSEQGATVQFFESLGFATLGEYVAYVSGLSEEAAREEAIRLIRLLTGAE